MSGARVTLVAARGAIAEHGPLFAHFLSHFGGIDYVDEARAAMDGQYQGEYDTLGYWAEDYLEQTGQLDALEPQLRCYFDHEAFVHDAEMSGDVFTIEMDGRVHVFWGR